MFLLIPGSPRAISPVITIYIPLCFYLYTLPEGARPPYARIYIPLCFYLYTAGSHRYTLPRSNLHSTMFLLIHIRLDLILFLIQIYIPLCFYLYPISSLATRRRIHLHSTMFLLIRSCGWRDGKVSSFTFHYVSTYTLPISLTSLSKIYLHSTMFLLIRCIVNDNTFRSFIYIPLCFYLYWRDGYSDCTSLNLHSTMFLLILDSSVWCLPVHEIYIPLCFYLYRNGEPGTVFWSSFTFHYVSTYTGHVIRIFTSGIDLHSTMFLLILRRKTRSSWWFWIYIPLCFYLYRSQDVQYTGLCWFTFHYVSTYTAFCARDIWQLHNLHSTMFLLIPNHVCRDWDTVVLFTFHYVSTYTISSMIKPEKKLHLHSTMFLLIHFTQLASDAQNIIYIPLCFYLYGQAIPCLKSLRNNLHSTMFLLIRNWGAGRQH